LLSTDVAVLVVAVTMEATPVTAPLAEVQQMDERPKQPKKLKDEAANAIRMEEWRRSVEAWKARQAPGKAAEKAAAAERKRVQQHGYACRIPRRRPPLRGKRGLLEEPCNLTF
jgi:hypothetical protein